MRLLFVCAVFCSDLFVAQFASCAPARGFVGVNVAVWDSQAGAPAVAALLAAAGVTALRWPGGSTADSYDWTRRAADSDATTPEFAHLAARLKAVATITTNYGTGSPQMAAAFAAYCNASPLSKIEIGPDQSGRDWRTAGYWATLRAEAPARRDDGLNHLRASHPAPFRFKNWEIGNECFGAWEADRHRPAHDPVIYALFAAQAMRLMRRIDPALRIGIVVTDQTSAGGGDKIQESVRNPVTGEIDASWNAVALSTLASHGVQPDFLAMHHYAQASGQESDAALEQDPAHWPAMIAKLRSEAAAYYPDAKHPIGIACTECNSVASNPGPQTTGLANAEYYAAVAAAAQKLGVESLIWWDLHNGPSRSGFNTRSPANRFPYGDYGILGWGTRLNKPYPVYYAMQRFATGH